MKSLNIYYAQFRMQFLTDFADFPSEQLLLSIIEVDQQLNLNMQYIETRNLTQSKFCFHAVDH